MRNVIAELCGHQPVRRAVIALTLLAMGYAQAGAEGLILCICTDGHVSINASCAQEDCCQSDKTVAPYNLVSLSQFDTAGDCCFRIPLYVTTENEKQLYDGPPTTNGGYQPCLTRVPSWYIDITPRKTSSISAVTCSHPPDHCHTSSVVLII